MIYFREKNHVRYKACEDIIGIPQNQNKTKQNKTKQNKKKATYVCQDARLFPLLFEVEELAASSPANLSAKEWLE